MQQGGGAPPSGAALHHHHHHSNFHQQQALPSLGLAKQPKDVGPAHSPRATVDSINSEVSTHGVPRDLRSHTLEQAFRAFVMEEGAEEEEEDGDVLLSAPHSVLGEDALLATLLTGGNNNTIKKADRAVSTEEHALLWLPPAPEVAMHDAYDFSGAAMAAPPTIVDGVATLGPPVALNQANAGGLPVLPMKPGFRQLHNQQGPAGLQQAWTPPLFTSTPALAPQPPPPPPLPSLEPFPTPAGPTKGDNKYASAIASAIHTSLGLELQPPTSAVGKKHAVGDQVERNVEALKQRLEDLLAECLVHLGYDRVAAKRISRGGRESLRDVEAHALGLVLAHLRKLVSLYDATLRGTLSNNGADEEGGGSSGGSRPAPPRPGGGGGAAAAAEAARFRQALALGLLKDEQLAARFEEQLKASACQLWAMMNVLKPHPSREIKESLARYTGRQVKQVTDWFTNWRARQWKKIINNL